MPLKIKKDRPTLRQQDKAAYMSHPTRGGWIENREVRYGQEIHEARKRHWIGL